MTEKYIFGVAGGDRRQAELAQSIADDGYTVYASGLEWAGLSDSVIQTDMAELGRHCDTVILPLPVTADGEHLNAPYGEELIALDDNFAALFIGCRVYGGMMGGLYRTSALWEEIESYDYLTREELAVRNAVPTGEGALQIAMQEYPGTLNGSRCLVAGFGRIGKVLSRMLQGLGAKVTVSARKASDLAWIRQLGYTALDNSRLGDGDFDIVFNTVPATVFTRKVLSCYPSETLLIDLASAPGGEEKKIAYKISL